MDVFHIVGFDASGKIVLRKKFKRLALEAGLAKLPPSIVGLEACLSAHFVSRLMPVAGCSEHIDCRTTPASGRPLGDLAAACGLVALWTLVPPPELASFSLQGYAHLAFFRGSSMAQQTYPPGTVLMRPMLDGLTRNWWLVLGRGIGAVIFGLLAIMWPGPSLLTLVVLFGAFALFDGGLAIGAAIVGGTPQPRLEGGDDVDGGSFGLRAVLLGWRIATRSHAHRTEFRLWAWRHLP